VWKAWDPPMPWRTCIALPNAVPFRLAGRLCSQEIETCALSESIVGVETSDKLTDPQIVAKVKEHYGIDR